MVVSREARVQEFISCARPPSFEAVWNCFGEECKELADAATTLYMAEEGSEDYNEARKNFVKEWADAQYTLSQIAVFYGIDGDEAFKRVADNNMTKVENGSVRYRPSDGKVLKPDGYVVADMSNL